MIAALHLVTSSSGHPLDTLSPLLTWAIIIGGVYGLLRLLWDLIAFLLRVLAATERD